MSSADLLRKAAAALDNGIDPLNEAFLTEHSVTLDECFTLAEHLAIGARMVADAIEGKDPQRQGMLMSIAAEAMR